MVRRNVCEQAVIEHDTADSVQHQRLGGDLHHAALAARFHHLMEIFLYHIGFRRRIGGREFLIPDDSTVCSNESGLLSGCFQNCLDHIACRSFSLCSGNSDGDQLFRRITESRGGKLCQRESSVLHPDHGHIRRYLHLFFYHKDLTARLQYVRNKLVGIPGAALDTHEYRIRSRLSRIIDHFIHVLVQISGNQIIFHAF